MTCGYVTANNSSPPGQNGRHDADKILDVFSWKKIFYILIKISIKIVSKGPIHNNSALV